MEAASPSPPAEPAAGPHSARGNVIKKVGEITNLTVKNKTAATFVVNSIEVDPACTSPDAVPAENGHLIAVRLSAETASDLGESPRSSLSLYFLWTAIADNGDAFSGNLLSSAAVGCLKEAERFPASLRAGQKATGTVVLDVPTRKGVLVNQQPPLETGWEWEYFDGGR